MVISLVIMCYLKLGQTQFNLVYLVLDYRDYTTNICFILKDYTTQKARQVFPFGEES